MKNFENFPDKNLNYNKNVLMSKRISNADKTIMYHKYLFHFSQPYATTGNSTRREANTHATAHPTHLSSYTQEPQTTECQNT